MEQIWRRSFHDTWSHGWYAVITVPCIVILSAGWRGLLCVMYRAQYTQNKSTCICWIGGSAGHRVCFGNFEKRIFSWIRCKEGIFLRQSHIMDSMLSLHFERNVTWFQPVQVQLTWERDLIWGSITRGASVRGGRNFTSDRSVLISNLVTTNWPSELWDWNC